LCILAPNFIQIKTGGKFQRQEGVKILTNLFLEIEQVENVRDDALSYFEAICALSTNEASTALLLNAFREAVLDTENLWKEIEQREDFKARYADREQAHEDFIREYLKNN
jgi:hypothetical protein